MINERLIYISDSNLKVLENLNINEDELSDFLINADIIFSKSEKISNPKIYHLEGATDSYDKFVCQVILHKDALIGELVPNQFSAKNTKPTEAGLAKPIHFPTAKNLFYSDSSKYTICQRKALGIEEDSVLSAFFLKNGRINISKTDLTRKPKPTYAMVFKTDQEQEVTIFATYFKEKARIYKFVFDNDTCAK
tara:strand:+ start:4842 stop:5420 length:579 start_codon:yes stop_codon:yes gene_type:complete